MIFMLILKAISPWFLSGRLEYRKIFPRHFLLSKFQTKHPWYKKVVAKNLKDHTEKDVESKQAAKASCC